MSGTQWPVAGQSAPDWSGVDATLRPILEKALRAVWERDMARFNSDLGRVEEAIEYYEKALLIAREIGDRRADRLLAPAPDDAALKRSV